jgi:hypothetical protein
VQKTRESRKTLLEVQFESFNSSIDSSVSIAMLGRTAFCVNRKSSWSRPYRKLISRDKSLANVSFPQADIRWNGIASQKVTLRITGYSSLSALICSVSSHLRDENDKRSGSYSDE